MREDIPRWAICKVVEIDRDYVISRNPQNKVPNKRNAVHHDRRSVRSFHANIVLPAAISRVIHHDSSWNTAKITGTVNHSAEECILVHISAARLIGAVSARAQLLSRVVHR